MDKSELKELKKFANELKPQFNIGKSGLTDTLIDTIDKYLEAHEIVKIKVLSAINKTQVKNYAKEISEKIDVEIIEQKGFTFTLYR
jgi:RNA-binding protein